MSKGKRTSCCSCLCGGDNDDDSPKPGYLYAFDFDHTIVDQNSDSAVMEIIHDPIPPNLERLYDGTNWTEYMDKIFRFVADEGGTCEVIGGKISLLKPTDGMIPLLQRIAGSRNSSLNSKFVIVSDANTFFIETYLNSKKPPLIPDAIITNQATIAPEGYLKLTPYENQTTCQLCPRNLCKGQALQKYIEMKGPFLKVYYVGDGGNDVCPARYLTENDVVFVRRNFIMDKIIAKGYWKGQTIDIKARIVYWDDAGVIEEEMEFAV